MGWGSVEAGNADLASWYRTPTVGPATLELSLWDGDPRLGGSAEVTGAGTLPRAVVDNDTTTWPNAPASSSITSAPIVLGPSVDAMDEASWWGLHDGSTDDLIDVGRLSQTVGFIIGADSEVAVTVTVSCPVE